MPESEPVMSATSSSSFPMSGVLPVRLVVVEVGEAIGVVDEADRGEGLWEVAGLFAGVGVHLLGENPPSLPLDRAEQHVRRSPNS